MKQSKLTAYDILVKPLVTEKTMFLRGDRKYTFEVSPLANKAMIRQAVEKTFNVKVESVNISNCKAKPKRRGRFEGYTRNWKKAIVTLKEGYTIKELEGER